MNWFRRSNRKSSCKGAEIIEVSLMVVPLFGMMFMLVDLSMVVFIRSTFQNAVREGVRYGITGANDTGPCQDDSVKAIVQKSALGFLNGSKSSYIHVHFTNPVTGALSDNSGGNLIQVSVEAYQFFPIAPYQHSIAPYMWARAFDVMEHYPGANPCLTKKE